MYKFLEMYNLPRLNQEQTEKWEKETKMWSDEDESLNGDGVLNHLK